jgi:hypothetical protein
MPSAATFDFKQTGKRVQILVIFSSINKLNSPVLNFNENVFSGCRAVTCGGTANRPSFPTLLCEDANNDVFVISIILNV